MADDDFDGEGEEEEEEVKIDPITLTPDLFEACRSDDTEKAKELLNGTDKHDPVPAAYRDLETNWSPLHWAACNGNIELVELLLQKGAGAPYKAEKDAMVVEEYVKLPGDEPPKLSQRDISGTADIERDPAIPLLPTLLMNTPLHWAAYKGHLRIAWLLLEQGFSPNDVDDVQNTPLHLAAANGHAHVVGCLLEDGANARAKNSFRNTALDVSTDAPVRERLARAGDAAAVAEDEAARKHAENLEAYYRVEKELKDLVDGGGAGGGGGEPADDAAAIAKLKASIEAADAIDISRATIDAGRRAVEALQLKKALTEQIVAVHENEPIVTQSAYTALVNKLARLVRQGDSLAVPSQLIEEGEFLIRKSHAEYWLRMGCKKLEPLACAAEDSTGDMDRLKKAIFKAEQMRAEDKLVATAKVLRDRLDNELELRRAVDAIPQVKLPIAEPPKDYWGDDDLGHIKDDYPDFPLPPPETNEYEWVPSSSLKTLRVAAERLDKALAAATKASSNEALVAEGNERAKVSADELKQLERKDDEDRETIFAQTEKAAKKLKKKKKKK